MAFTLAQGRRACILDLSPIREGARNLQGISQAETTLITGTMEDWNVGVIDTKDFRIQKVKVERLLKRSLHESGLTRTAWTEQEKALIRRLKKTVDCFHFESKKGNERHEITMQLPPGQWFTTLRENNGMMIKALFQYSSIPSSL